MRLDQDVLAALERPASGGKLIERLQAAGHGGLAGQAVLVYGALVRLIAAGRVVVAAAGQAEIVYARADDEAPQATPARPGFPPSFSLAPTDLALAERGVYERTKGLPSHYFEELRRVVVADADRRVFHGAKLPLAVQEALAALGPAAAVRRYLRGVEKGRAPGALPRPRPRWTLAALVVVALLVATYVLVLDVRTIPPDAVSMAPTLFPAAEGGDRIVLVLRYAQWFDTPVPGRGDLVVFELPGAPAPHVKRVWGLSGERIRIEQGDLIVDDERLVKDRALLDRVRVPLFGRDDFVEASPGRWEQERPAVVGYRRPDGALEVTRGGPCRDVVARVRVRWSGPGSATVELVDGRRARFVVLVADDRFEASADGVEVARTRARVGGSVEIWLTNADRVFRVEVDGQERARVAASAVIREPRLVVTLDGETALEDVEVARDLVFLRSGAEADASRAAWTVPEGHYFVLGDNSAESRDSRLFGPVDAAALRGRPLAVLWPWGRLRALR